MNRRAEVNGRGRVLFGCNAPANVNSGMAGTVLAEGAALASLGWDVHYSFAPESHWLAGRVDRQLTYLRVPRAVRHLRPDVAVISSGDGVLLPWLIPETPLVVESHGLEHRHRMACGAYDKDHFGWGHRLIREPAVTHAMSRAAAVVVKTDREAAFIIDRLGIARERAHVIPNGVDDMFFEIVRHPAPRPTVVWIAGWTLTKGVALLPEILGAIARDVADVTLHVVGCGVPEDRVRAAFPRRLQSNLRVTPHTDRHGVAAACDEAWVGLSTSYFEGFGNGVLEMLATGLPVVATPVGVAPDVVVDGGTGSLVGHDAGKIGAAVVSLLQEPEARSRMGRNARASAGGYRWADIGSRWSSLLHAVMDGAGSPSSRARLHNIDRRTTERNAHPDPGSGSLGVSVVVPTWKRPAELKRCLEGLLELRGQLYEIIVVRRADDDEAARVLDPIKDVREVVVHEQGVVAAMEVGTRATTGDVVAFIDDDAVPRAGWLEYLLAPYGELDVGAVGGRDVIHRGSSILTTERREVGRITWYGRVIGNHHLGVGGRRDVQLLKGVNMSFRRGALAFPHGFRGTGAQVHYEVALCSYARAQGWRIVYDPRAQVDHYPAPRPDGKRGQSTREEIRASTYNLLGSLLSVSPGTGLRRLVYALVVGDAESPGIVRTLAAVVRGESVVLGRVMPSLQGHLAAVRDFARGGGVRLRPLETHAFEQITTRDQRSASTSR